MVGDSRMGKTQLCGRKLRWWTRRSFAAPQFLQLDLSVDGSQRCNRGQRERRLPGEALRSESRALGNHSVARQKWAAKPVEHPVSHGQLCSWISPTGNSKPAVRGVPSVPGDLLIVLDR